MITKFYFYEKDHNELMKDFEECLAQDSDHIYDDTNVPRTDSRVRSRRKDNSRKDWRSSEWGRVFELQ